MIFNDVVTAVSRAIFSEFGEGYKIYAEAVEQGLEEPCFFVQCINSTFKKEYENQARMKFFFCVQFFPEDKLNPVRECLNISERLFALLDRVPFMNGTARGENPNSEIHDGVLSYFFNFDLFVEIGEDKKPVLMERLDKIIQEVKL